MLCNWAGRGAEAPLPARIAGSNTIPDEDKQEGVEDNEGEVVLFAERVEQQGVEQAQRAQRRERIVEVNGLVPVDPLARG